MIKLIIFFLLISLLLFIFYMIGRDSGRRIKNSWYCVWQSYHEHTLSDGTIIIGCFVKIIKAKSKEEAIGKFVEIVQDKKVTKRMEIFCDQLNFIY